MKPGNAASNRIHALWDGLAAFDACRIDAALDFLMRGLCALVDADGAEWIGLAHPASGPGAADLQLCEAVPPRWLAVDPCRIRYGSRGHGAALYGILPVGAGKACIGLFRAGAARRFTATERDIVAEALRGTRGFQRHALLSHGLLVADAPLTPVERRVLQELLTGQAEKAIAAKLGQSPHTTHSHVGAIFRKFGVRNRPALMALWLNSCPSGAGSPQPPA